jgi:hypothetical protein
MPLLEQQRLLVDLGQWFDPFPLEVDEALPTCDLRLLKGLFSAAASSLS